jgi:transposase
LAEYGIVLPKGVHAFRKAVVEKIDADLLTIPGLGPITATALIAAVSDVGVFDNGRHFSAWLGWVPKQHSTGGQTRL